ncbi:hypothetical protein ABPG77_006411 [Micractinium sp. CCAP 211/92]
MLTRSAARPSASRLPNAALLSCTYTHTQRHNHIHTRLASLSDAPSFGLLRCLAPPAAASLTRRLPSARFAASSCWVDISCTRSVSSAAIFHGGSAPKFWHRRRSYMPDLGSSPSSPALQYPLSLSAVLL